MTELAKLIDSASRANHGRSMQAAADLATRGGAPISKSHISKNARKAESLTPQLVRGIAAGYGIAEEDVVRAILADLGFTISDYNPTIESQIRRDPDISADVKEVLLAAVVAARTLRDRPQTSVRDVLGSRNPRPRKHPGVNGADHREQRKQL